MSYDDWQDATGEGPLPLRDASENEDGFGEIVEVEPIVCDEPRLLEPVDRELNVAIRQLTDRVLPRGFEVVQSWADVPTKQADPTRPIVGPCMEAGRTIFADAEIDHAFRALVTHAVMLPDNSFTEGGPTPKAYANAFNWLREQLHILYDGERVDRWYRLLTFYWWGPTLHQAYFHQDLPDDITPRELAEQGLRDVVIATDDLAQAMGHCLNEALTRGNFRALRERAVADGVNVRDGETGEVLDDTHAGAYPADDAQNAATSARIH